MDRADRRLPLAEGFADHREPRRVVTPRELRVAKRLFSAYEAAKEREAGADPAFAVRGLWREWIEVNYRSLLDAVGARDAHRALGLLENFSREQFAVGTGAGYEDLLRYRTSPVGRAYVRSVWCHYRDRLAESGFDLTQLTYPSVGNPIGLPLSGGVVGAETLRHAYNAQEMANLLQGVRQPEVLEIGGGFGGQAYQVIGQLRREGRPPASYLDFDLPEVQIVAGYFLMGALGEDEVCLCGEGEPADRPPVGVFPHFSIDEMPDDSVDLVFNSHSFSEMDRTSARHYLHVIERICRGYFFHINHDTSLTFTQPDGTFSTNLIGSRMVPDQSRFRRIHRQPWTLARPEDRPFPTYAHLYRRFDPAGA
jgi:putative sugar O-methyltransferase